MSGRPSADDAHRTDAGPPGSTAVARAVQAFVTTTDYALAVFTVMAQDGRISGCLVGFFTQCSIEPPRFLICVSRLNHTYSVSQQAVGVGLHLLGQDQTEVATLFAQETGDTTDKFERCQWHPGVTGTPVLDACTAWVEGTVLERFDVGDHQALLIRPVAGGAGDGQGLLTFRHSPPFRPGHPAEPS